LHGFALAGERETINPPRCAHLIEPDATAILKCSLVSQQERE
jgi:hypothetical protein